ncbi:MAG: TolB family protein [Candidatus Sericytochromatia bacterium]
MNRQISRIVSATLAGLAVTLTGCASQQSASNFWKDHYVYVSAASGNNDIYLSDLQGKGVKQLTSDPTDDAHPRVSITGEIVFASRRTGTWQIYSMKWDGSQVRALTNTPGTNNYRPYPSPDGRVVFVSDRLGKPHIFSVNPDGSGLEQLSEGDFWYDYPVVADDGHIYFTSSRNSKWDIWKMGPDGSRATQLTKIPQNIQEIAVVSSAYKDFDERFTNRSPMIPFYNFSSQNRLVFSAYTPNGNLALYRVNEDGSELRQLSVRSQHTNRSPVLQPSGQVIFTSDRNGSTDIWTMYPDGMQPRPLTSDPAYESTS